EEDLIKNIQKVLNSVEEKYNFKLSDSSYIGLVIHLALVIKRLQNFETIAMDKEILLELENIPEFKIADKIAQYLSKELKLEITKDEVGYITMHIKGAKLTLNKIEDNIDLNNLDIRKISSNIIQVVENDFQIKIVDRDRLNRDLSNHLIPAISRLSMKLNIRNPLLDNIKEKYSDIFKSCEKACEILKDIVNVPVISESEIAYIALHFAAAIQRTIEQEKIVAVIVCPSGIGTSRLLASDIQREFSNIIIKDRISIMNIDIDDLKNQGVDCIISTVKLDIDYKCILVNPLLSEDDKERVRKFIKEIINNKTNIRTKNEEKKSFGKEEVQLISNFGDKIINLLENLILRKVNSVSSINELIYIASQLFANNEEERINIENGLLEREKIQTTYLDGYDLMLLHCKTESVKECRFGVVQLNQELQVEEKRIKAAMVSLIPLNAEKIELDIISEISGEVIENSDFTQAVKVKDIDDIKKEVEKKLTYFYKKKVKLIIK
ncbi:MAG: PRD domain-containing protein, partial [Clostridium sp.]|nr:PRD domain-containing protein [Clostridium sp.]